MKFLSPLAFLVSSALSAAPIASFEVKPVNFVAPEYEGSNEYKAAVELHLTSKISVFFSHLESQFKNDEFTDENWMNQYNAKESTIGAYLYSNPSASSLFIGAGSVRRNLSYEFTTPEGLPLDWNSVADDPLAKIGYRWNFASFFHLRLAVTASWTRRFETKPSGETSSYYLSQESANKLQNEREMVEGKRDLKTGIDIGLGLLF